MGRGEQTLTPNPSPTGRGEQTLTPNPSPTWGEGSWTPFSLREKGRG